MMMNHKVCKQSGFSLVEVLVAMLVLAIGLLGLAALQTQGVRFNHDAYVRTNATSLAYDIVDKMRLNRSLLINTVSGLPLYTGATVADVGPPALVTGNFPARNPLPTSGLYSVGEPPYNCTGIAAAVASVATDLACWLNGIELGLPDGQAAISIQGGAPTTTAGQDNRDLYDITLFWMDRQPRNFGDTSRLAQNQAECELQADGVTPITNRTWLTAAARCYVTQTWTIWP
jgi:prepilin-type N-terminal cleavage/methylation domain-containing protein